MAHVTKPLWLPVETAFGPPQERTWRYPITTPEMDMVISSTRGQTRLHDVTVFIFNPAGQVALIRKPNYPQGVWRAPGGGIKPGESLLEGALREMHEETGLTTIDVDRYILRVHVTFTCGDRVQPWVTHVLTARTEEERLETNDPHEIEELCWGSLQDLCSSMADQMLAAGRGLFTYRVDLHRAVADILLGSSI
jgi:8-oxo-dGTP pyrophosphatase MutT (NUDIX family)